MRRFLRDVARGLLVTLCLLMTAHAQQDEDRLARMDQLLAPIALYPDALLNQILMASTYPADVIEAAGWSRANPELSGDEAVRAVSRYDWDPSVQSLVAFPQVLATLESQPDWVQELGDAFLAEPGLVMDRVQYLRLQARRSGKLVSNTRQRVIVENGPANGVRREVIVIESVRPTVVYVPVYDPVVVFGPWWWPAFPPYHFAPPPRYGMSLQFYGGIGFGVGVFITDALWSHSDWHRRYVLIDVPRYNRLYRAHPLPPAYDRRPWTHDPAHRGGVAYRDLKERDRFMPAPGFGGTARPDGRRDNRPDGAPGLRPDKQPPRPGEGWRSAARADDSRQAQRERAQEMFRERGGFGSPDGNEERRNRGNDEFRRNDAPQPGRRLETARPGEERRPAEERGRGNDDRRERARPDPGPAFGGHGANLSERPGRGSEGARQEDRRGPDRRVTATRPPEARPTPGPDFRPAAGFTPGYGRNGHPQGVERGNGGPPREGGRPEAGAQERRAGPPPAAQREETHGGPPRGDREGRGDGGGRPNPGNRPEARNNNDR
ncbi:DUF3300 domain-containing protein [Azoarcus indigens]|uniref:Uncharacterized protein DUF3300 n=1 Tax=Azoarcus indigens TaxID=29545 RepID=A0A4R6DU69_9RHOO|nr:DUF3300 domain-containing protein [Azoarcus indigens]NMG67129.1 DUF3300 domain-containing protein [Azoarcus indigens]TDN48721.1 uncharacterized protein DUF3300 [Azoarcus indigens]